jgi:pSer/pThr/pTyr-binding forkhead associated (FHA) protein
MLEHARTGGGDLGQEHVVGENPNILAAKPPRLPKSAPHVRLAILAGPGAGQTLDLTRCVTLLGSRPGCKLQLRSSSVAPVHCAIVNTGVDVYLRDLVSTTGTYLNDLPAVLEKLDDGDTLKIADWEIRVEIKPYALDTLSDMPHVSLEPEPTAIGVEVNGSGRLVRIARAVGVIGRRPGCDVVVDDGQVSRVHALLFTYTGQPAFCDLLSHNGVALEGAQAHFGFLHSGDTLEVGPVKLRLILPGVARRKTAGAGSNGSAAANNGQGKAPASAASSARLEPPGPELDASADGTVIPIADDESDRVDIRAAEIDR